jgi:hypothetical protein
MGSRVATSRTKEALFPMFLQLARDCAEVDCFWQRFFNTMATGRFPKGVNLREDCLVHRSRKKTSTFELTAEARSDWDKVAEFFRTTCDIRSERDWLLRRASGEVVVQLTTAQINKRVKKEHANAIPEYTIVLKTRYALTPAEMSDVDVLLRYYSSSNLFRPGDVVYGTSGIIRDIKTLYFDEETRRFTITAEAKAPRYSIKESYQDAISYLSCPPFTKTAEKKGGFDEEIGKQLRQLYAPQIAAREKAALQEQETKTRRKAKKTIPVPLEEPQDEEVVSEGEIDPIEDSHHHHRSDDDSA